MNSVQDQAPRRRGVVTSSKRGKYSKTSNDSRERVMLAYQNGEDWQLVAKSNGINHHTAYNWIRTNTLAPKPKGGKKFEKLTSAVLATMLEYISDNPLITLQSIKEKLQSELQLTVSTTAIHNRLDGQFYSVKKIHAEPSAMNNETNKMKRRAYVEEVSADFGAGRNVVFMDETNVNLFTRRNFGRARKGARCSVLAPTSKGANVHIIAAINQSGRVYWERRRGAFKKDDAQDWVRSMCARLGDLIENTTLVIDNAPCHSDLESICNGDLEGLKILRLAPYSAPLNPIEETWSTLKAHIKSTLAEKMPLMLRTTTPPSGISMVEFRLQFLEEAVDTNIHHISPQLCLRCINHVQRHYPSVLALEDLGMGDIPAAIHASPNSNLQYAML